MVVNEEWLAGNDEYIERKVLKELKLKRKREEKKSPGRWTKGKERVINVEEDVERKRKIKGKGKEKVVDVEEDAKRKRNIKVKGKEKVVDIEKGSEKNKRINKQKNNSVLKGRATVRQLFEALRGLSPKRKKVIREMGFRDLIEFPIFEIQTKLAKTGSWTANREKETGKRRPERVQQSILAIVERPVQKCQQLTIKALSDVIIETKNSEYMIRLNILTLIANTLGSCENRSTVNFTVLKNVFKGNDVSDIDLCSYIIECASVSKFDWATKLKKGGCVLWASDVLDVKRRLPTFKSWNTSLLKKRKIAELQNDYMRIGEIQDDVREGEEPNQKELLQLKQRMKEIFKEPEMPEYLSSSSSESDDDNDDWHNTNR
ncbi:hypothetical protein Tco_0248061 [Tanacetum coccineum]